MGHREIMQGRLFLSLNKKAHYENVYFCITVEDRKGRMISMLFHLHGSYDLSLKLESEKHEKVLKLNYRLFFKVFVLEIKLLQYFRKAKLSIP